jgi:hypothetical protein
MYLSGIAHEKDLHKINIILEPKLYKEVRAIKKCKKTHCLYLYYQYYNNWGLLPNVLRTNILETRPPKLPMELIPVHGICVEFRLTND